MKIASNCCNFQRSAKCPLFQFLPRTFYLILLICIITYLFTLFLSFLYFAFRTISLASFRLSKFTISYISGSNRSVISPYSIILVSFSFGVMPIQITIHARVPYANARCNEFSHHLSLAAVFCAISHLRTPHFQSFTLGISI